MNLKIVRISKNIVQWDLAKATGISQSKISLIERGQITPTDEEMSTIAKALDVSPGEIEWASQREAC